MSAHRFASTLPSRFISRRAPFGPLHIKPNISTKSTKETTTLTTRLDEDVDSDVDADATNDTDDYDDDDNVKDGEVI
jgi:hypothetical protein